MTRARGIRPARWIALLAVLAIGQAAAGRMAAATAQGARQAPRFEVDPLWPKPLPNHWVLGNAIGVWVDDRDRIWIIHRGSSTLDANERALELKAGDCCAGAPPVLAFDTSGNLVQSWGGPGAGYDWPAGNHGIFVDHTGMVWIGGNGPGDSHILKFTQDGTFVAQYGKPNARETGRNPQGQPVYAPGSSDPENFGRVAKIFVDPGANEAYVADGYLNRRVAVLDASTGRMKRFWGAYGQPPSDAPEGRYDPSAPPSRNFRNPVHCADLSHDGLLYVCDRLNDRLQVFRPDGTFVKEAFIDRHTRASGSVWDVAFSKDREQRFLFAPDGINNRINILDRQSLEVLTTFGDGGRQPGQFYGVHSIAIDSVGNLYTTETWEGKRLQKFVNRGLAPVTTMHQGTVWPAPPGRP